jgi:acid stress chaperone HdeB
MSSDVGPWYSGGRVDQPRKDHRMLFRRAALLIGALALAAPACAQKWDLATVTCEKFLSFDKNTVNILLAWVDGYYREDDDPPIIDLNNYLSNAKKLGDYCRANPEISLISATDKLFEKK